MIIILLAAAMTIAMLIATVFGLHEESQHAKERVRARSSKGFGFRRW
jgi:hypothetical protein